MWLYGEEPRELIYHAARFSGHRHCDGKDKLILSFLVILQAQVIKVLSDFNSRSPLRYVTILISFVAIGTQVVDICFQFVR